MLETVPGLGEDSVDFGEAAAAWRSEHASGLTAALRQALGQELQATLPGVLRAELSRAMAETHEAFIAQLRAEGPLVPAAFADPYHRQRGWRSTAGGPIQAAVRPDGDDMEPSKSQANAPRMAYRFLDSETKQAQNRPEVVPQGVTTAVAAALSAAAPTTTARQAVSYFGPLTGRQEQAQRVVPDLVIRKPAPAPEAPSAILRSQTQSSLLRTQTQSYDMGLPEVGHLHSEGAGNQRATAYSLESSPATSMSVRMFREATGGAFRFNFLDHEGPKLDEQDYDVRNYYWEEGVFQAIARSEVFASVTMTVIVLNCIYIGVDADNNQSNSFAASPWPYQFLEHMFTAFFVTEWIIRFGAFKVKRNCLLDGWFKFDTALAVLGVLETWVLPEMFSRFSNSSGIPKPLRLLRLARLARMVRLLRFLPELLTMLKGMMVATRAVGSSLILLAGITYVFAIVMFLVLKDEDTMTDFFGTLPIGMWTLLISGCFLDSIGDLSRTMLALPWRQAVTAVTLLLTFTLLSSMTVMNMLIGILCEVVSAVAAQEKETAAVTLMKKTVLLMLKGIDADGSGEISQEELDVVFSDPEAIEVLQGLKVDLKYLRNVQEMLYAESSSDQSISTIMDFILCCRGDSPAKNKDVMEAATFLRWLLIEQVTKLKSELVEHINWALGIDDVGGTGSGTLSHSQGGASNGLEAHGGIVEPPGDRDTELARHDAM